MEVVFQSHPVVEIATNRFVDVPTIIQFEDTVYDTQGTKIAVVKGARVLLTEAGKKARIQTRKLRGETCLCESTDLQEWGRHEPNLIACELEGTPILELRKSGASALRGWAELWAPEGILVKANDAGVSALLRQAGSALTVKGVTLQRSTLTGCKIGIHVRKSVIAIGVGGGSVHIGYMEAGGRAHREINMD